DDRTQFRLHHKIVRHKSLARHFEECRTLLDDLQFKPYLIAGKTVALLGSSGVGKSTIVNVLLGKEIQSVNEISNSVHKGRHTTTTRQLFLLDNGAMLIDTPGMREIQFWGEEESISAVFEDIEDIMSKCRFSDCTHNGEPGCAIAKALETGELDQGRYQNYLSLQAELALLEQRKTKSKQQMKKEWEKEIAKKVKEFNKSEKGKFGR
ncbi:MAG TPA: ribosome small subunit-dependent GTPase A, partial [bacterium]|nr:ribosome small subunit-dependent GTPase A [bacterium]